MKRVFLSILLAHFALITVAQTPYTNVVNHVVHDSRPALEIVGDYYYVANTLNIPPYSQMQYVKMDTLGTVLDTLEIVWDPNIVFPSNCPKCLDYHNGVLYHAYTDFIASVPGTDTAAIILCKVRADLSDTIMTRYYPTLQGHGLDIKALEFDSDSTFIITATNFFYTGDTAPQAEYKFATLVARLDTSFNILWETIIPDTDSTRNLGLYPDDIEIDSYGTLLVTGTPIWLNSLKEAFIARLRIDNGQLLWRKVYTSGSTGIHGMSAVDHGDGTYRYVKNWITDVQNNFHELRIGILDTTGNIISEKAYGRPNRRHAVSDLIQLNDGNYYCAGITYWGGSRGLGFKFTPQLDSLWMRQFQYGPNSNTCYLEVFKEDSSGMIAHTGWVTSNQVDNWIFRIDSHGCDTSNCQLSIPENMELDMRWRVYPNPSTGKFFVDHPEMQTYRNLRIRVFDMLGRELYNTEQEGSEAIEVELHTSGEYQIVITDKDGLMLGSRPVIIR